MNGTEPAPERFYLMDDGRVIMRTHEPPGWLQRSDSIAELRLATMCPDGSDAVFRKALLSIADDMAACERSVDALKKTLPEEDLPF